MLQHFYKFRLKLLKISRSGNVSSYLFVFLFFLTSLPAIYSNAQQDTIVNVADTLKTNIELSEEECNFGILNAAFSGKLDSVIYYADLGADINAASYEGVTALMFASQQGHIEVVKWLVENGAAINRKPESKVTALIGAAQFNHEKTVEYLVLNGANIDARDEYGATSVSIAAVFGYYILTDMLLFYGADPEIRDNQGNTAQTVIARHMAIGIVKLLEKIHIHHDQGKYFA